jgi:hypothetical protein
MISYNRPVLLLVSLFIGTLAFSQNQIILEENLSWSKRLQTQDQLEGESMWFNGEVVSEVYRGLPVFQSEELLRGNYQDASATIDYAVFEPAGNVPFTPYQLKTVTTETQFSVRIVRGRDQNFCSFQILPFRLTSSGKLEKLVSFKVQISTVPGRIAKRTTAGAEHSVLSEGTWYKIAIGKDGVYKIDYNFLSNELGLDMNQLDPESINIYGNGGELMPFDNSEFRYDDLERNAIFVQGESDGLFGVSDYILFYGKGVEKWRMREDASTPNAYDPARFLHTKHYYSDSAYYYLKIDDLIPERIPTLTQSVNSVTHTVTKFQDHQVIENDISNLNKSGRQFFGEHFDINTTYNFTFDVPNVVDSAIMHVQAASRSIGGASTFNITYNGGEALELSITPVGTSSISNVANIDDTITKFSPSSSPVAIGVSYDKYDPSSEGWLDFITLNSTRNLIMVGNQMHFRDTLSAGSGNISKFQISNGGLIGEIWDITDITDVSRVDFNLVGGVVEFTVPTDNLREFVAFTGTNYLSPRAVGRVDNQDLHAIKDVDMIILSSPLLVQQAQNLADIHEQHEGIKSVVVTPMSVYNEFSSGNPDVTGIKMFMKHVYEQAESEEDRLKYLCIFGDGAYTGNKSVNSINSYTVITYQSANSVSPTGSFVSDDYFAFLDDDESESFDDKLDIGVGRIPAESADEAAEYVNKVQAYLSDNLSPDGGAYCIGDAQASPYGTWRNNLIFVSDDQDGNGAPTEKVHMEHCDEHADTIYNNYNDFNVIKIYLDAYQQESTPGGERYPDAVDAIKQQVQNGALIVTYVGHGGEKGWSHERVLDIPLILSWTNFSRLPVFLTATCELARFDNPEFKSAGELLVLNPRGGAIAMLTTTRIVFSQANQQLGRAFYKIALEDEANPNLTLGEICRVTKNDNSVQNSSNKRNFSLLGSPALRMSYPKFEVYTTHLNDELFTAEMDTVKSLQEVSIKGFVGDEAGNILSDFTGFVYPTVFDKKTKVTTLNNDEDGVEYEFDVFKNIIYKGKASVTNGEFEFSFIIPKDINYNFGTVRISYYAVAGNRDAHGNTENFVIGGSLEGAELNTVGPDVSLFMNDTTFVFGGITDEDPFIMAKMHDENGINTVGNGIGHDIAATLDGQTNDQIILNDFYESDLDTYQSGEVRYQLSGLSEGTHNLKIKVWDVHNNSSEAYTEFVVAPTAELALDHVLNYPNPFTTRTEFYFEHNQVCDLLDVQIQVFTVGGKLVKTIDTTVESEGFRSHPIVWDGKDDFGDKIGRGVYVYRVKVITPEGQKAEQFEKLVILN